MVYLAIDLISIDVNVELIHKCGFRPFLSFYFWETVAGLTDWQGAWGKGRTFIGVLPKLDGNSMNSGNLINHRSMTFWVNLKILSLIYVLPVLR